MVVLADDGGLVSYMYTQVIDAVNADAEDRTKANRNRALEDALLEIGKSSSVARCRQQSIDKQAAYIQPHPAILSFPLYAVESEVPECWIIEETRRKFAMMMQEVSSQGKSEEEVKKVSEKIGFDYSKALFSAASMIYQKKYNIP